ncbi:hypothetical protein C0Q70_13802 [Pomacea canaliculata]|uniref:Protein xylosyltransferase n=1 Tax=Pomacea canaliculata TaxID=400727 RepID=A0A2T7NYA4_POMCA|nr:hypothetical protein C0Q70_13802 [Pomacea canaliculata]
MRHVSKIVDIIIDGLSETEQATPLFGDDVGVCVVGVVICIVVDISAWMRADIKHAYSWKWIETNEKQAVLRKENGFIMSSLTREERKFPIAYSILVFKDAYQVVKLLQVIYRPQNVYCLHVDNKSDTSFHDTMAAIVNCFDNVFLTSRRVEVLWGRFTVLEPELICMKDLWAFKKWKYFINLTGQEFPLKTNLEIVRILTAYNGANDIEGTVERANKGRWASAGPPPHGIVPVKGSVHIAVNRDFVDYVLHSPVAQDFLNWTQRVFIPDEAFFSTLNHNPQLGIRGSYKDYQPAFLTIPQRGNLQETRKAFCY